MAIILGTNGDDLMTCRSGNAVVGLGGNDTLRSTTGSGFFDQQLLGGAGNDTYIASAGTSTAVMEKGGGYDTLHMAIAFSSPYTYIYTIDSKHLFLGDYTTECLVTIPNVYTQGIDVIQFSDGYTFDFQQFVATQKASGMLNYRWYANDVTAYLASLCETYDVESSAANYIGVNLPAPPPPDPFAPFKLQYFNEAQYLQNKTDALNASGAFVTVEDTANAIAAAGMMPWDHFRLCGAFEFNANGEIGIDPSAAFDTSRYYEQKQVMCAVNGDFYTTEQLAEVFRAVGLDPLTHYALCGQAEGMTPYPVTSLALYAETPTAEVPLVGLPEGQGESFQLA